MKRRGQRLRENVYYSSQREVLEHLILDPTFRPVLTDFTSDVFFLSSDRVVFYLIPFNKFFLRETLWKSASDLFRQDLMFVSDLYCVGDPVRLEPTGNLRQVYLQGLTSPVEILEVSDGAGNFRYLNRSALYNFPKKINFIQYSSDGPIFIESSLHSLLGGIFPATPM